MFGRAHAPPSGVSSSCHRNCQFWKIKIFLADFSHKIWLQIGPHNQKNCGFYSEHFLCFILFLVRNGRSRTRILERQSIKVRKRVEPNSIFYVFWNVWEQSDEIKNPISEKNPKATNYFEGRIFDKICLVLLQFVNNLFNYDLKDYFLICFLLILV